MARYNEATIEELAKKANKQKKLVKIVPIVISMLIVAIGLLYLVTVMYTKFGSFTVSVNKYDQINYGISLYDNRDFLKPTASLLCRASEEITNIDGRSLDQYDLGSQDGEDNGENYVCYTFYCKNTGKKTLNYEEAIVIVNMTLNIESAVRVRVVKKYNDEKPTQVDYARAAGVDEYGNPYAEENTEMFYAKNTIMCNEVKNFAPGDVMKYTVVIWLEGPDKDCIDDIIGGEFKIDMKFSVIGTSEDTDDITA